MAMKTEPFVVNIGPQHPSTHGVFRMRLTLDGERIIDADMVIGYLHRSMEKLAEERSYTQNIPFTDRTDYVAAMTGNLAYVLAVEKLCGIEPPERAQWLRVIMSELQRFASHSMAVGVFANDCGTWQTPVMHMFREREKVLDLFEMDRGARLTTNYMRIGGVSRDVPPEFIPAAHKLMEELPKRMGEYDDLLLENEIIVARWSPDYIDPHSNTDSFAHNPDNRLEAKLTGKLAWRNSWFDPEINALTEAAAKELDLVKRKQMYADLQQKVQMNSPFSVMFQHSEQAVLRKNVKGYVSGSNFDLVFYRDITK